MFNKKRTVPVLSRKCLRLMRFPSKSLKLIVVGLTLISTNAFSFNENGFLSGMTIEAVNLAMSARGGYLRRTSTGDTTSTQSYMAFSGQSGSVNPIGSFGFCSGVLYFYSTQIAGGFPAFTRLLERATRQYGRGLYETQITDSQLGPYHNLTVTWSSPISIEWITLGQINDQSPDVSQSFRDPQACFSGR